MCWRSIFIVVGMDLCAPSASALSSCSSAKTYLVTPEPLTYYLPVPISDHDGLSHFEFMICNLRCIFNAPGKHFICLVQEHSYTCIYLFIFHSYTFRWYFHSFFSPISSLILSLLAHSWMTLLSILLSKESNRENFLRVFNLPESVLINSVFLLFLWINGPAPKAC